MKLSFVIFLVIILVGCQQTYETEPAPMEPEFVQEPIEPVGEPIPEVDPYQDNLDDAINELEALE